MSLLPQRHTYLTFSILCRIGEGATPGQKDGRGGARKLSVSSVGSERVQLEADVALIALSKSFSILCRIGEGATCHQVIDNESLLCFQYPLSDRRGCNCAWMQENGWVPDFQYPLSDRRGCNSPCAARRSSSAGTFQYPLSDRRGCNPILQHHTTRFACLSVSSVGSERVQLGVGPTPILDPFPFSILCRIGEGATDRKGVREVESSVAFSILCRIGEGATKS